MASEIIILSGLNGADATEFPSGASQLSKILAALILAAAGYMAIKE